MHQNNTLRFATEGLRLLRSCCSLASRFWRSSCSSWEYKKQWNTYRLYHCKTII